MPHAKKRFEVELQINDLSTQRGAILAHASMLYRELDDVCAEYSMLMERMEDLEDAIEYFDFCATRALDSEENMISGIVKLCQTGK